MRVVRASIRDGHFTAIVDMKGDPELVQEVAGYARQWNRPMWVFSDTGPSRYDPFRHGDYNRKRDLLMATSEWTEAHYKARAGDYLLAVFYLLDVTGVPAGTSWLHRVAELLDVAKLQQAAAALPASDPRSAEAVARVTTVVNEVILDPRSVGGLAPRVRALTATRLGAWVKPGEPEIDLEKIWDVGGVVVFSLPSLSYPEAATAFGGLAVQDLKTLAGTLGARGNKQPGLVFVDEFATLGSNNVSAALAMSRSSGLAWMLATQDLGDLKVGPDGAAFEQKVLTNTNLKVLHAVGDPETAERLAKLAGSKWTVKERASVNLADSALDTTTGIASGQGFVDALLGPVVEPTNIMNQSTGEKSTFILINKMGAWARTNVHTVRDMALKPGDSTAIQWLPGAVASVEEQEAAARVAEDIEVQDMLQMDAAEIEASVAMKPVRDFGESAIPQQVTPTRVAEDFDHWGDPAPSSQAPVEAPVRPAGWHAGVDTTPAPQPDMRTASESAFWTTTPAPEPPAGGYTAHPVQPASAPAVQPVLPPLAQPVIPQMPPVVPGQPFVPQAPLPVTYDPPQPRKAPDGPRKAPVSETSMNDTDGWWD